jgi:hypothetical protein
MNASPSGVVFERAFLQKLFENHTNPMKKSLFTLAAMCAALFLGNVSEAQAQVDPSGTWSWATPGRNDGPERKFSLTLKVEGEKLVGKISTPGRDGQARETDISDGKVTGNEVTFNVVREFNNNKFTTKYAGKITGNELVGKTEMERNGRTLSRDWKATRATDKK